MQAPALHLISGTLNCVPAQWHPWGKSQHLDLVQVNKSRLTAAGSYKCPRQKSQFVCVLKQRESDCISSVSTSKLNPELIWYEPSEDIYTRHEQNLRSSNCIRKSISVECKNWLVHGLFLLLICDILNISTSLKQGSQLHQKADKIHWSGIC